MKTHENRSITGCRILFVRRVSHPQFDANTWIVQKIPILKQNTNCFWSVQIIYNLFSQVILAALRESVYFKHNNLNCLVRSCLTHYFKANAGECLGTVLFSGWNHHRWMFSLPPVSCQPLTPSSYSCLGGIFGYYCFKLKYLTLTLRVSITNYIN